MKTVKDYLDLGLVFVGDDKLLSETNNKDSTGIRMSRCWLAHNGYDGFLEVADGFFASKEWVPSSFAWRNNEGVKPEYNGVIDAVLNNGWKVRLFVSELVWIRGFCKSVAKWSPVVLKSESDDLKNKLASDISSTMGSPGLTANGIINALSKAFKPKPPFWNKSMPSFGCPCVAVDIDVTAKKFTIKEEAPKTTMTVNIEGHDYLLVSHAPTVSPREGKPMKPVYTAEMHSKGELPPVGAECIYVFNDDEQYIGQIAAMDGDACWFKRSEFGYKTFIGNHEFKPIIKTIKVNGFDVPAPMSEAPEDGKKFFIADTNLDLFCYSQYWSSDKEDFKFLTRGLIHSTKSAAIAHAKAMLGIDPNV